MVLQGFFKGITYQPINENLLKTLPKVFHQNPLRFYKGFSSKVFEENPTRVSHTGQQENPCNTFRKTLSIYSVVTLYLKVPYITLFVGRIFCCYTGPVAFPTTESK